MTFFDIYTCPTHLYVDSSLTVLARALQILHLILDSTLVSQLEEKKKTQGSPRELI